MAEQLQVVTISYADLIQSSKQARNKSESESVIKSIGEAFGNNDASLGIVFISDIPNFQELRKRTLQLTHRLGNLQKEVLEKLEDEQSFYSVGWSHGKERVEGDKLDHSKGSYYFNPVSDTPLDDILLRDYTLTGTGDGSDGNPDRMGKEEFLRHAERNGAFYAPNIWPDQIIEKETGQGCLPELKESAMDMGNLIRDVGLIVARQCDEYVLQQCKEYTPGKIENIIKNSLCCKARLLHYFPVDSNPENMNIESNQKNEKQTNSDVDFSNWCGWHNDHCSLTGLVPAIYTNSLGEEVKCPDPSAGLYIKARDGRLAHVNIPINALAFQIGGKST